MPTSLFSVKVLSIVHFKSFSMPLGLCYLQKCVVHPSDSQHKSYSHINFQMQINYLDLFGMILLSILNTDTCIPVHNRWKFLLYQSLFNTKGKT